jgi:hypothetical protein
VSTDASNNEVTVKISNNQGSITAPLHFMPQAISEPVSEAQHCADQYGANIGGIGANLYLGPCYHSPTFSQFFEAVESVIEKVQTIDECFKIAKYGAGVGAVEGIAVPGIGDLIGASGGAVGGCIAGVVDDRFAGGQVFAGAP